MLIFFAPPQGEIFFLKYGDAEVWYTTVLGGEGLLRTGGGPE
jgi:hypothetical protein